VTATALEKDLREMERGKKETGGEYAVFFSLIGNQTDTRW